MQYGWRKMTASYPCFMKATSGPITQEIARPAQLRCYGGRQAAIGFVAGVAMLCLIGAGSMPAIAARDVESGLRGSGGTGSAINFCEFQPILFHEKVTPCKARIRRQDALRYQSAQVFCAKIPPSVAGPSAGCMALAVGNQLVKNTQTIGMGSGPSRCRNCGGWLQSSAGRLEILAMKSISSNVAEYPSSDVIRSANFPPKAVTM